MSKSLFDFSFKGEVTSNGTGSLCVSTVALFK